MRKLFLLVALILVPAISQAVPLQLAHHGQLLDADGEPITGTQNITFRLWDADSSGNEVWSEVISVDVVSGHYSALLNLGEVGRDALRDEPSLWLELEIGGSPLLPRQPVAATPYALVADTAENVVGGTVDAASIAVNGTTVIDGTGSWTGGTGSIDWTALDGVPADQDTLAGLGLSCADQSVAKWDDGGGQWVCATDLVLTSGEVLGMVDGAVVNLGTGSQVAGVDIATLDDITWGNLDGIPGGFVDGIDDDLLGGLSCADGDRAVWDAYASMWDCGSEVVDLDRLDVSTALDGQVLTHSGGVVGWETPDASTGSPCELLSTDLDISAAEVQCGSETVVLRTWSEFSEITLGANHACGLRTDGTITCWGQRDDGRTSAPSGSFTAVAAGNHNNCALTSGGTISCWGLNDYGQSSPPAGTYSAVSAGEDHACALTTAGTAVCWGRDNHGQASPPGGVFDQIALNDGTSCALTSAGAITCWGYDANGQATPPSGVFTTLDMGSNFGCAIQSSGALSCWGSDTSGQSSPPGGVFVSVSAGSSHACAVQTDGQVACWGQDGDGETDAPPLDFDDVDAGYQFTCGLPSTIGRAVCWGANTYEKRSPP